MSIPIPGPVTTDAWVSWCAAQFDGYHAHEFVIAMPGRTRPVLLREVLEPSPTGAPVPAVAAYWFNQSDGPDPCELIAEYQSLGAAFSDLAPAVLASEPECVAPWAHGYEVDDTALCYGPGPWPFYRAPSPTAASSPQGPAVPTYARFAPDACYGAWRNEYVCFAPHRDMPAQATAVVILFARSALRSASVAGARVTVDLVTGRIWVDGSCPVRLRAQAHIKGGRLVAAVARHREARDAGRPLVTAWHRHVAGELAAGRWITPVSDADRAVIKYVVPDFCMASRGVRGPAYEHRAGGPPRY